MDWSNSREAKQVSGDSGKTMSDVFYMTDRYNRHKSAITAIFDVLSLCYSSIFENSTTKMYVGLFDSPLINASSKING